MYEFLEESVDVSVVLRLSLYEATEFVKSGILTHTVSHELELESKALDRSAILTLYIE